MSKDTPLFEAQELHALSQLRLQAAEYRNATAEIEAAQKGRAAAELHKQELEARLEAIPPTKMNVEQADKLHAELTRAEFLRSYFTRAERAFASKRSSCESEIGNRSREMLNTLHAKFRSLWREGDPARARAFGLVQYVRADSATQAEHLVAGCEQLGAKVPTNA